MAMVDWAVGTKLVTSGESRSEARMRCIGCLNAGIVNNQQKTIDKTDVLYSNDPRPGHGIVMSG
jgi:hypothetical protein